MKQYFIFILFLFSSNFIFSQNEKPEESVLIMYGSDSCHYCTDAKKYAIEQNIKFVYYDIDKDERALKEMLSKLKENNISLSNLNLPVVDKKGYVFTNEADFNVFLKKLNK